MKTSVHTKTCVWLFIALLFSSVTQSCLTLWDPKNCSTPGFPDHHRLLELAHTHVHQVSDAIHPSHPLSSPWPPAFNLSQHQGLFPWVSSLHQVAKILEFQLQISPLNEYSGLISFRIDLVGLISLQSNGLSIVFSSTTVQKHQFLDAQPSLWSNSHIHMWPLEKPQLWLYRPLSAGWCLCFLIHCLGLS